jgi:colanic acid biosynthesis glycosyl transferase WcaI
MRVFFVNRFYWPETPATGQLLTDVAEALASDGQHVTVITSRSGTSNSPQEEIHRDVRIVRIRTPRCAPSSVIGKALAFAAFWSGGTWQLLRLARRGDIIVTLTDPPLFGVVSWLIGKFKRVTTIHWVQDIYPEVAIAVTGHRWLRGFCSLRNAAWRAADACVTVSAEMSKVILESGVDRSRIAVIPNWAPTGLSFTPANDPAVLALRREWRLENKFAILYSGNLGRVHDLEPILIAAQTLRSEPKIVFVFIGGGAQRDTLAAEVRRSAISNVIFLPAQPREHLTTSLAVGDIHLVTLRPGCERFVFPSKLYGIAAVGRPVLFVGPPDCELASIVRSSKLGRIVNRDDPNALVDTIRELAADPAAMEAYRINASRYGGAEHTAKSIDDWRHLIVFEERSPPTLQQRDNAARFSARTL